MSECPNCGSAAIEDRYYGKAEWICGSHGYGADYGPQTTGACGLIRSLREELAKAQAKIDHQKSCIRGLHKKLEGLLPLHGAGRRYVLHCWRRDRYRLWSVAEQLQGLSEELAEARDAERDRIADHLELRASKLEDELAISETSSEVGLERMLAVIKSLRREAQAIRSNEHRSNG